VDEVRIARETPKATGSVLSIVMQGKRCTVTGATCKEKSQFHWIWEPNVRRMDVYRAMGLVP